MRRRSGHKREDWPGLYPNPPSKEPARNAVHRPRVRLPASTEHLEPTSPLLSWYGFIPVLANIYILPEGWHTNGSDYFDSTGELMFTVIQSKSTWIIRVIKV